MSFPDPNKDCEIMPEKQEAHIGDVSVPTPNLDNSAGDAIVKEVVDQIVSCSIADAEILTASQQTKFDDPRGTVTQEDAQVITDSPKKSLATENPMEPNGSTTVVPAPSLNQDEAASTTLNKADVALANQNQEEAVPVPLDQGEVPTQPSVEKVPRELEEGELEDSTVSDDGAKNVSGNEETVAKAQTASASGDTVPPPAAPSSPTQPSCQDAHKTTPSAGEANPAEQIYHIKWIEYGKAKTPIVTQNSNGPCPLVGIMNVLLIRGQVQLPDSAAVVTGQQLMHRLGDCILRLTPEGLAQSLQADYEANVSDAVAMLPKLMTGLDVNVRFTGISDFEYTRECIVFDLLGIPLYHGWLVDSEQERDAGSALGNKSYNQLVEFIINSRSEDSTDEALLTKAVIAEQFLENTASQLTYHGLCELNRNLKDGELAVFFRNNHFSTMLKNRDELFLLVTDQGFLEEGGVVWETLNSVDGDSHFVDAFFHSIPPKPDVPLAASANPQNQIDKDYLMALSLEEEERKTGTAPSAGTVVPSAPEQTPPVAPIPPPSFVAPAEPPVAEAPAAQPPTVGTEVEGDAALARQLQALEDERAAAETEERMNVEAAKAAEGAELAAGSAGGTPPVQTPTKKEDKCRLL